MRLDHTTGRTKQFVYLLDSPSYRVTDIEAVSNTKFLVDERDGKFFGDPSGASGRVSSTKGSFASLSART